MPHGPPTDRPHDAATATEVKGCAQLDIGLIYTHERAYMTALVPQLRDSGDGLHMRLLLVDNASRDGVEDWRRVFPDCTVLRNARRLGYAANLNRVLAAASAPYVLLLNTDMAFDRAQQCCAKMVRFMDAHPECGLSTCAIFHPDGSYANPARRWQTPRVVVARRGGLGRWWPTVVADYLYQNETPESTFACDWVSGCFMLVRRDAYLQVGPFDTRFGKYFEDVDYCRRLHDAGWSVVCHGGTRCVHFEQRASNRLFSRDAARHFASYVRWLWKWRGKSAPDARASFHP